VEDNIEVIYPEIGYFELATVIDNLKIREKPTKGSRMNVFSYMLVNRPSECFFTLWDARA
jgi:hypothetical protein